MKLNRIKTSLCKSLLALGLMFGEVAGASAQESEQVLAAAYPPESITTVQQANEALKKVTAVRADIANRTAQATADCLERFFTSSCLSEVRERDRKSNKMVRRVEVEANALLRKERAAERDRAVAQREQRAAEQRAKAITITGSTREPDAADDDSEGDDAGR